MRNLDKSINKVKKVHKTYPMKPVDFKAISISIFIGLLLAFLYSYLIDLDKQLLLVYGLIILLSFSIYKMLIPLFKSSICNYPEFHYSITPPVLNKFMQNVTGLLCGFLSLGIFYNSYLNDYRNFFKVSNYSIQDLGLLSIMISGYVFLRIVNTLGVLKFVKKVYFEVKDNNDKRKMGYFKRLLAWKAVNNKPSKSNKKKRN